MKTYSKGYSERNIFECLSDIPTGCGTEKNERLHRHLNRSLLCGVAKIGPELAIAVMTCVLFAWNWKCNINKSLRNKRAKPVMPVEIVEKVNTQPSQQHMKAMVNSPVRTSDGTSNDNFSVLPFEIDSSISAIKVEQRKTLSVLNYIIQRVLHVQDFINFFT